MCAERFVSPPRYTASYSTPDSGLVGCTVLSGAHQFAASGYPKIVAQFAGSRWPDLRYSGMAYVEIATRLLSSDA